MAALDTNVLIRFLVEDDTAQLAAARKLIRHCVSAGETLFVPVTVALELEWVLRSTFGFGKPAVLQTLSQLLSSDDLSFESEGALEVALALYTQGAADFSDCLHVALASSAGHKPLWTFDNATAKGVGARLVTFERSHVGPQSSVQPVAKRGRQRALA
jgi:predicted nucleic-acid-binding protein